jgi:hypothetical protein
VRVALTLSALNDLDVKMDDNKNAYLAAPLAKKVRTVLGPKFVDDAMKRALVLQALYGLKSVGAVFRNHLVEYMKHMGWKPCCIDHDLWRKADTCHDDGVMYWAYILICVDGILCVYHDHCMPLTKMDGYFKIKGGSIQVPTFCLGEKLKKTVLYNGVAAWGTISSKYVQSSVQNVQEYLTEQEAVEECPC